MRNLEINKSKLYVLNYKGKVQHKNSAGNLTGETIVEYTKPTMFMGHISSARGSSQVEMFGVDVNYDKSILITKNEFKKLKITENSVFFIDKKPEYEDLIPMYDYRVIRIAETINEVAIAVKKVEQ